MSGTGTGSGARGLSRPSREPGGSGRRSAVLIPNGNFAGNLAEEQLGELLGGCSLGTILDLGCGDGSFLDELLSIAAAVEVWGLDPDEDALSEAKSYFLKAGPDIPYYFFRGSSLDPGLPRGDFDTISFQDMLHHLSGDEFSHGPTPASADLVRAHLDRAESLLVPGGLMICSESIVDADNPPARQGRVAIHNLKAEIDSLHGIPHSWSFDAGRLGEIIEDWAARRGMTVDYLAVHETQRRAVLPGREDRAVEKSLEYYSRYLDSIDRLVESGRIGDGEKERLVRRLADIRRDALVHGLLAQKRMYALIRKGDC